MVDDGSLWTLPPSAASPTNVEPKSPNPTGFTSDDENVYWFNSSNFDAQANLKTDGAIWRVRASDGTTTELVSGLQAVVSAMAVEGSALYVAGTFEGTPNPADDSAIFEIPLPNGALEPLKFADATRVGAMVSDASALYWTDLSFVARCPHSGCAMPEVMAPGQTRANALAQDQVSIFWISDNVTDSSPVQRLAK